MTYQVKLAQISKPLPETNMDFAVFGSLRNQKNKPLQLTDGMSLGAALAKKEKMSKSGTGKMFELKVRLVKA